MLVVPVKLLKTVPEVLSAVLAVLIWIAASRLGVTCKVVVPVPANCAEASPAASRIIKTARDRRFVSISLTGTNGERQRHRVGRPPAVAGEIHQAEIQSRCIVVRGA